MKKSWWWAILVFGACLAAQAQAADLQIQGNANFWWVLHEQVENGQRQAGSGDLAAQEASGFGFRQGRIAFRFESSSGRLQTLMRIRLEERTDILDAWGGFQAKPWFGAFIGQMKIPSTGEVLEPDELTNFIVRSTFARSVSDYSLSRTPYISSLMATRSYDRDLGVALKGAIPRDQAPALRYFLMVSNGIGANNFIGGKENPEFMFTNNFGDFFYGARLELEPYSGIILGGHYCFNRHNNSLLQDKKTMVDLDRFSWSSDLQVHLPWATHAYGFYGKGRLRDFWTAESYWLDYEGWGVELLQGFFKDRLQLGVRYDTLITELMRDDNEIEQNNWTFGLNFRPLPAFRLQVNYVDKNTVNEFADDLDDNIFYANFQFLFEQGIALAKAEATPTSR